MLDLDELEKSGAIERADVAVENHLVEIAALADLHVGADDLLVHVRRAHELDRDGADLVNGGRSLWLPGLHPGLGTRLRESGHDTTRQKAEHCEIQKGDPAHRVTDESFQSG